MSGLATEAAGLYLAKAWQPVPLPPRSKGANRKNWNTRKWLPKDFGDSDNIGVILGEASGNLVDLDLDIQETRQLADAVFGALPAFGRKSVEFGHRLVVSPDQPGKTRKYGFKDAAAAARLLNLEPGTDDKCVVLELRARGQTMFPPSIHPSGEPIVWRDGAIPTSSIPQMPWNEVERRARALALAAIVLRAYPRVPGSRNEISMALVATLVRLGLDDETAENVTRAVASLAGDEEANSRGLGAASARIKLSAGEPCTSLPRLLELLGLSELETDIRGWLGLTNKETRASPPNGSIAVQGGALTQIVDEAEAALLRKDLPIFQRGGELVRTTRRESVGGTAGAANRCASVLTPVCEHWLMEQMGSAIPWLGYDYKGKLRPVDPPIKYARVLLARKGAWRFPALRGLCRTPTLDADGRIIEKPGYDAKSGLFLDIDHGQFPQVPQAPSREEARLALEKVARLVRGFPFVSPASHSVALSAILTALVRPTLRTAPLHAFDAPTAGTGKSKLTDLIGILATGQKPAAMAQGKSPEEDEKRLAAALRSGDVVLFIDNCEREVESDFLCSMLTQEVVKPRILGRSETMELPTNVLVLANGNNFTPAGDMSRRVVLCRMDAGVERPDEREFDFDCVDDALADREALVVAGLTALRGYIVAGRPSRLVPFGSFPDWDLIRGALVWLDEADPAETRSQVSAGDPRKAELAELMAAWEAALGAGPVTLAHLHRLCSEADRGTPQAHLLAVLTARTRGAWNARSVGWYLRRYKDRVLEGHCFRSEDAREGKRWRLEDGERSPPIRSTAPVDPF